MDKVIDSLVALIPSSQITAEARDSAVAAIVKNIKRADVGKRFVDR